MRIYIMFFSGYVGCYKEESLSDVHYSVEFPNYMTIETCAYICLYHDDSSTDKPLFAIGNVS